jgi:hypothetical protein
MRLFFSDEGLKKGVFCTITMWMHCGNEFRGQSQGKVGGPKGMQKMMID